MSAIICCATYVDFVKMPTQRVSFYMYFKRSIKKRSKCEKNEVYISSAIYSYPGLCWGPLGVPLWSPPPLEPLPPDDGGVSSTVMMKFSYVFTHKKKFTNWMRNTRETSLHKSRCIFYLLIRWLRFVFPGPGTDVSSPGWALFRLPHRDFRILSLRNGFFAKLFGTLFC